MRKQAVVRAVAVCAAVLVSASLALAGDNWIGTWKVDVAKSKYSPGPAPRSATLKYESTPAGIRLSTEIVDAEGKLTRGGFTAKFDGKEVPLAGNPNADTGSPRRIDDNTYENVWKKAGKVTITARGVVSADGKTLTITQTGTDVQGRAVDNTVVFDRQ
jgi:hypothetical protein